MGHLLRDKLSKCAADLIEKMLVINVAKRYDILQVLDHPWFATLERRESENEHRLAYKKLNLPMYERSFKLNLSPSSPRSKSVFIDKPKVGSPRTCQLDHSSALSPRVATLNETPVSLRLSQKRLSCKLAATGLKTPRESDNITPRLTVSENE